jgi:hypothetical protein
MPRVGIVSEVVSKLFRPKIQEVAGSCRKTQYENPQNISFSPNIIMTIKSRGQVDTDGTCNMGGGNYKTDLV